MAEMLNPVMEMVEAALNREDWVRTDLALDLMRALHAQVSLTGPQEGFKRFQAHQRLAAEINDRLAKAGHEVVLGVFPKGASTQVSLFDLDEKNSRDWVVGFGPAQFHRKWHWALPQEAESDVTSLGVACQTLFWYDGDSEASLPAGVYYRRRSLSGRHDYLVMAIEGWAGSVQVLDPALCPIDPAGETQDMHKGLTTAFRARYQREVELGRIEFHRGWRERQEEAAKTAHLPEAQDPWQVARVWQKAEKDRKSRRRQRLIDLVVGRVGVDQLVEIVAGCFTRDHKELVKAEVFYSGAFDRIMVEVAEEDPADWVEALRRKVQALADHLLNDEESAYLYTEEGAAAWLDEEEPEEEDFLREAKLGQMKKAELDFEEDED